MIGHRIHKLVHGPDSLNDIREIAATTPVQWDDSNFHFTAVIRDNSGVHVSSYLLRRTFFFFFWFPILFSFIIFLPCLLLFFFFSIFSAKDKNMWIAHDSNVIWNLKSWCNFLLWTLMTLIVDFIMDIL